MYGSRKPGGLSGSASSILERAKGQLKGQRYGAQTRSTGSLNRTAPAARDTEADDLNAYLSQLSMKASGKSTKKINQDDSDDSEIDISLSSEEGFGVTNNSTLNASKFLKKSQSQTITSDTAKEVQNASKPLRKSSTTPNFLNKTAPGGYTSSALQKAAQLGAKFAKKKTQISKTHMDSDSEEELKFTKKQSVSEAYRNKAGTAATDVGYGNKFLKKTTSPKKTFYVSDSDEDSMIKTDHEDSFGKDGNRFLKKKSSQSIEDVSDYPKKDYPPDNSDEVSSDVSVDVAPAASRFLKKKVPSGTIAADGFSTSTPKKSLFHTEKDKLSRTAPVVPSSRHLGMSLDSDDEDMKEFIENLTPTSSPEVPPVRKVDKSQHKVNRDVESIKESPYKRSLTPGPVKRASFIDSSSESSQESVTEDFGGSKLSDSIDEDIGGPTVNIMRFEDLEEPDIPLAQPEHQQKHMKKTTVKKSTKAAWSESEQDKSEDISSVVSEIEEHPTLNLAGLQTIDDLLFKDQRSDKSSGDEDHDAYGSDFETATEIGTQRTAEVPDESIYSEIKTARNFEADNTHSSDDSSSRSISESSTRTIPDSYATTSYSKSNTDSKSSRSYSRSSYTRNKTRSGKRSTSEQTQTYSEDFDGTDTELQNLPSDDDDTATVTRSVTSYSETTVIKSVTPKKHKEKHRRRGGMRDASVQANGTTAGLLHHWITDSNIASMASVTQTDPTPVTTHVINPEAMEALTNFSPSLLALNSSLLTQLQLARESVQNTLRLHRSLVDSISNDFEYTTVDNTKEFIERHRRPKLTMEQALIMVKQEMEEENRL